MNTLSLVNTEIQNAGAILLPAQQSKASIKQGRTL